MMRKPIFQRTYGGNRGRRRLVSVVILILILLVFAGMWQYRRNMTFEGVIVEKDRRMRWSYAARPTAPESRRYRHFVILEDDTGRRFRTQVTYRTYAQAEEGDPILKRRGDWWPRLQTDEAIERRERSAEGLRMMIDAVRNGNGEGQE